MTSIATPSKPVVSPFSLLPRSNIPSPKLLADHQPAASINSIKKRHKSAAQVDATTTGPNGRDRFVGNLDITCDADEPLLKETGNRFVLFPIKYHEASHALGCSVEWWTRASGLAG